jgi:hypothetical protein
VSGILHPERIFWFGSVAAVLIGFALLAGQRLRWSGAVVATLGLYEISLGLFALSYAVRWCWAMTVSSSDGVTIERCLEWAREPPLLAVALPVLGGAALALASLRPRTSPRRRRVLLVFAFVLCLPGARFAVSPGNLVVFLTPVLVFLAFAATGFRPRRPPLR